MQQEEQQVNPSPQSSNEQNEKMNEQKLSESLSATSLTPIKHPDDSTTTTTTTITASFCSNESDQNNNNYSYNSVGSSSNTNEGANGGGLRRSTSNISISESVILEEEEYKGEGTNSRKKGYIPIPLPLKRGGDDKKEKSGKINSRINDLINMHNISNSLFPAEQNDKKTSSKKFSFKDFVEKMKHKSAMKLVKKIKAFIDQTCEKDYGDDVPSRVHKFLASIMDEIRQHPQWKNASENEIENASESIEKYVMTKIHGKVFSPTLEDLQEDEELASRLTSFKNLKPEHLDMDSAIIQDPVWPLAIEEFKKINRYKSPRDKMTCISNCCKLLFNIIQNVDPNNVPSADTFFPILTYLVLKSNPPHLHSNIKFMVDFRDPNKLHHSEAGYFLTNVDCSVRFWKDVDHTSISIDKAEFDKMCRPQYFDEDDDIDIALHKDQSQVKSGNVDKTPTLVKKDTDQSKNEEESRSNQKSQENAQSGEKAIKDSLLLETPNTDTLVLSPKSDRESSQQIESLSHDFGNLMVSAMNKGELLDQLSNLIEEYQSLQISDKFMKMSVNEVKIGELIDLLSQYKLLYRFYKGTCDAIHESKKKHIK